MNNQNDMTEREIILTKLLNDQMKQNDYDRKESSDNHLFFTKQMRKNYKKYQAELKEKDELIEQQFKDLRELKEKLKSLLE